MNGQNQNQDQNLFDETMNQNIETNPNFYDDAVSGTGLTAGVKQAISKWYNIIKFMEESGKYGK